MAKIYNEIAIDMNHESSSYGETLYEDSFEYIGDMMLMQGGVPEGTKIAVMDETDDRYHQFEWRDGKWVDIETMGYGAKPNMTVYSSLEEASKQLDPGTTEWGAPNITADMFVNPDGTPRTVEEVYNELDPILTNKTGKDLIEYILDLFPKYTGVPKEEIEHEKEALEIDVYALRGTAGQVGQLGQTKYRGGGSGMREQIAGKRDIATKFGHAQEGYRESIYGLEEDVQEDYLADVMGHVKTGWFADPGAQGEDIKTTPFDKLYLGAREGGRVPTVEETFLDVLTRLPDAGGN